MGSRTSNVIPKSVCDPTREHMCSAGGPEFHAGCNPGSGIPYVIPNSVRHPMRDHLCRTGPGIPCGMHCGVLVPAREHDFSAGPTAGSWLSWCARNSFSVAQARIRIPGRDPDIHAGFHSVPGMSYGTWMAKRGYIRSPGPRTGSGATCGIQCGIRCVSQDPESHAELHMLPYSPVNDSPRFDVGPRPVRDPGYRISCRTPGAPCGIKSYMHVSHAGSVTP